MMIRIPIRVRSNLKGIGRRAERIANATGRYSLYGALQEIMSDVNQVVLSRYDSTSRKSAGTLREKIDRIKTMHLGGSIVSTIGDVKSLPFYWKFQEFGTKAFTFKQPFSVIFSGKDMKLIPIKKSLVTGVRQYSATLWKTADNRFIKFLDIKHPGIKKRGFFLSGKLFLETHGNQLIQSKFSKVFKTLGSK